MNYERRQHRLTGELRPRVLTKNFMRSVSERIEPRRISTFDQMQESMGLLDDFQPLDISTLNDTPLVIDLNKNYSPKEVCPEKWVQNYNKKFNELLVEKFGPSCSPYITPRKLAVELSCLPDGDIQATIDFIEMHLMK
jgi:hypothetical protein